MEESKKFNSPEEFFSHFKRVIEELKTKAVLLQVHADMHEEELVAVLSEIDPKEAGLEFFTKLGAKFFEIGAWELLNVIKTHIEYNFDVEIVTKNGVAQYEIRKGP